MDRIELRLPSTFDDFAWDVESKGWYSGAYLVVPQGMVAVTFYDPVRLAQDIEATLDGGHPWVEHTIIVVARVTRSLMQAAVADPHVIAEIVHALDRITSGDTDAH